jgi:hypothetical protein
MNTSSPQIVASNPHAFLKEMRDPSRKNWLYMCPGHTQDEPEAVHQARWQGCIKKTKEQPCPERTAAGQKWKSLGMRNNNHWIELQLESLALMVTLYLYFFKLIYFFYGTRDWTQGLMNTRQTLNHWAISSASTLCLQTAFLLAF